MSEFPHGIQIRSLLVHHNVKLVYAKMASDTSRTAFALTRQTCTAILAVRPLPHYSKNTKRMYTSIGLLD